MSNQNTLRNKVDGLYKAIHEAQEKHKAACVDFEKVITQALDKPDVDKFTTAQTTVEFYEAILARLFEDSRKARLDLWTFELEAARAELLKMGEAYGTAKARLNQAILDKGNFLRGAVGRAVIEESAERLSSLEILIVDYRTQLHNAERNRNIAKRNLAELEKAYNDEADELDAPKIPEPVNPLMAYA